MCFKKIFGNNNPVDTPMVSVERRLLTFGKNIYGNGNDLNGCVNDSKNLSKRFKELFTDADIRIFLDGQVTVANYKKYVSEAIATLRPGSLVWVIADSCFSKSVTKLINSGYHRNRFYDPGLDITTHVGKKLLQRPDLYLVELSGSDENETSADVMVNGQYQGALSFALIRSLTRPDITINQVYSLISAILPGQISDQHPKLTGPDELINRPLNSGQLLAIHNSSHGSWEPCPHGDEADGRDEGLYFDKFLSDDEMYDIYNKIPLLV